MQKLEQFCIDAKNQDSTEEARRNMSKVAAVPPRRSAVLTVFRGATTINDGTTVEPRRAWRCHCGLCRTSSAVAPRLRCDGGITKPPLMLINVLAVSVIFLRYLDQQLGTFFQSDGSGIDVIDY